MEAKEQGWSTNNLGIAAFLLARGKENGVVLTDVVKIRTSNMTGTFVFGGDQDRIKQLTLDYQGSPEKKFDDEIRYLKSLCKQGIGGR